MKYYKEGHRTLEFVDIDQIEAIESAGYSQTKPESKKDTPEKVEPEKVEPENTEDSKVEPEKINTAPKKITKKLRKK